MELKILGCLCSSVKVASGDNPDWLRQQEDEAHWIVSHVDLPSAAWYTLCDTDGVG